MVLNEERNLEMFLKGFYSNIVTDGEQDSTVSWSERNSVHPSVLTGPLPWCHY